MIRILKGKTMIVDNQSGFSIIEVLMAMLVLAVGILGISYMQAYFAGGNSQSRQIIRATDLAVNQIEILNNIADPSDADLSNGNHTKVVGTYERDYTLAWNVTDNGDGTMDIDVSVSWRDNGLARTVNFPWVKSL